MICTYQGTGTMYVHGYTGAIHGSVHVRKRVRTRPQRPSFHFMHALALAVGLGLAQRRLMIFNW